MRAPLILGPSGYAVRDAAGKPVHSPSAAELRAEDRLSRARARAARRLLLSRRPILRAMRHETWDAFLAGASH